MAERISSIDVFLKTFKVGDNFWYVDQQGFAGQVEIVALYQKPTLGEGSDLGWAVDLFSRGILTTGRYVEDVVNKYHGVFLDEESAREYEPVPVGVDHSFCLSRFHWPVRSEPESLRQKREDLK
jgi:hypothetical protein